VGFGVEPHHDLRAVGAILDSRHAQPRALLRTGTSTARGCGRTHPLSS